MILAGKKFKNRKPIVFIQKSSNNLTFIYNSQMPKILHFIKLIS